MARTYKNYQSLTLTLTGVHACMAQSALGRAEELPGAEELYILCLNWHLS